MASEFAEWLDECAEWARETWVAESPADLACWTRSFPILRMENGDYLALDERTPSGDPRGRLLVPHDDESKVIARSFTGFLAEWARLGYVGPESWMIEGFLDGTGTGCWIRGVKTGWP